MKFIALKRLIFKQFQETYIYYVFTRTNRSIVRHKRAVQEFGEFLKVFMNPPAPGTTKEDVEKLLRKTRRLGQRCRRIHTILQLHEKM